MAVIDAQHFPTNWLPLDLGNPINEGHPFAKGLVAWWGMAPQLFGGKTWYDFINNYSLILRNFTLPAWVNYFSKPAMKFSETTTYVESPSSGPLDFSTGSFTFDFWINITQNVNTIQAIIDKRVNGGVFTGYHFYHDNSSGLGCQLNDSSVHSFSSSRTIFGGWHHVVWIINRNTNLVEIYLDGNRVMSSSISGLTSFSNTIPIRFGFNVQSAFQLNGGIHSIRCWNYALPVNLIPSLYNNSLLGYPDLLNRTTIIDIINNYYFDCLVGNDRLPFVIKLRGI